MEAERVEKEVGSESLKVYIFSFGFKHGVPVDANLLFDVRFLPNPYWQEHLRPKSGLELEVSGFVIDSDEGKEFLSLLKPLLLSIAVQTATGLHPTHSTPRQPPWSATSSLTSASPIPEPSCCRVDELSTWWKRSNMWGNA